MSALTEGVVDTHPEWVQAVREGVAFTREQRLRFLVAVTTATERPLSIGGHQGAVASISLDPDAGRMLAASSPTLSALVHHPPFSLVLADSEIADHFPHADCSSWMQMDVEEVVSDLRLSLPVVHLPLDLELVSGPEDFEVGVI